MVRRNLDLFGIVAWALATVAVVLLVPSLGPVRVALGLPFVLFFPGYALVAALFSRKDDLDPIERIALSVGLSIAVVPLIGLGLNYSPWGIRLGPILAFVTLFIVLAAAVAVYRRRLLPADEAFAVVIDVRLPQRSQVRIFDRLFAALLVLSLVGLGLVVYSVAASRGSSERFTEFYVLGPDGKAQDYPTAVEVGGYATVVLGVANHEGMETAYRVEIAINGQTIDALRGIRLADGDQREETISFSPEKAGANQKVEFRLYKEGVLEPYRAVHLWVDVGGLPSEALVAGASLEPSPLPPTPVLTPGPSGGLMYHLEPGDTLTDIAERFQVDPWAVATANGMSELEPISAHEDIIIPGTTYIVQAGDTLASIAAAFGVSPAVILEANGIADANTIYAGQEVAIPGAWP